MKKMIKATAVLMAASVLLSGCAASGAGAGDKKTLTVFNYSEYLDPEAIEMFTKETGIEILYEEALTPEDLYTKYKSGAVDYDLICTSDYMLGRLINEGELAKIDYSTFENKGNIGDKYWEFTKSFDPDCTYTMPYFWGTVGILYNTTKVHGPIDSWDVLFNHEYKGDIIMQNSIRDTYMVALKYLGYSLNTTNEDEIAAAQKLLIDQRDDVQAYLVDEARDEVVAGNAAMAVVYSGEAYLGHDMNPDLEYVIPKEGTNVWVDSFAITKKCDNMEGAQKFLDFLCREDIAEMNFRYIYYSTPNEAVIANLDDEERNNPALVPPENATDNCEVNTQSDEATAAKYNELWKELKSGI
ncbi:MAG: ABC transporter substrate-binding protein [Clostridiales bacterium]|nr:ABC transporter substrate-binding protein [Clostridiales bacterium]